MQELAISILDAKNVSMFLEQLNQIEKNLFQIKIHFDVMDGKFVPNLGVDISYLSLVKEKGFDADVHLMVEDPIPYIKQAVDVGVSRITIHYEIEEFEKSLEYLNTIPNLEVGVSVKPNTSLEGLKQYQGKFSHVLIMSVEPGMGGQAYIAQTNEKIKLAKLLFPDVTIQVDGGINLDTIKVPIREKIDSIVIGSFLTKKTPEEFQIAMLQLNIIRDIETLEKTANVKLDTTILQIVPGGYGQNDCLLGISVPVMRKCAKRWYSSIPVSALKPFIQLPIHDYRRFAIFCIENKINKGEEVYPFLEENLQWIDNWDLTDVVGPNIFAPYLETFPLDVREKKLEEYIKSDSIWKKRIGIVSLLYFVKKEEIAFVLKYCDKVIYESFHLFQKATGWVLREAYKKEPDRIIEYLHQYQVKKKLPNILLNYACEKMSKEEKEFVRGG